MVTGSIASSRYKHLSDLIDKKRIGSALDHLAMPFVPPFGSQGVTRLPYSEIDTKGETFVARLMMEAGLEVRVLV